MSLKQRISGGTNALYHWMAIRCARKFIDIDLASVSHLGITIRTSTTYNKDENHEK